jgi:glycosyltransferase involved in cell wall biosynthesis
MRSHRNTRIERRRLFIEKRFRKGNLLSGEIIDALMPVSFRHEGFYHGRVFKLKEKGPDEKGVILINYNETMAKLRLKYDMSSILKDYNIALELSYYGCCIPEIMQFLEHKDSDIVVGVVQDLESRFLERLEANIHSADYSSSTWVDDRAFYNLNLEKEYDCIMVAMWNDIKRHYLLFEAIKEIGDPSYRACLVGGAWGRVRADIEEMADYYGIRKNITVFEKIPPDQVNVLLNKSKVNLLLSLKEGGNKAIVEGMFADVPAIVLSEHLGIAPQWINENTGMLADKHRLKDALLHFRTSFAKYRPRDWAMNNISCKASTAKLEKKLKELATNKNQPWITPLAIKVNRPECEYYDDNCKLTPFNLEKYLRR